MEIDKIIVLVSGLAGIGFIAWFFFGKKDEVVKASDSIDIIVNGGYNPSAIVLKKDAPVTLRFTRTDPNSCLEDVVLPDFKIKQFLPLHKTIEIKINSKSIGEFPFSCGMRMFHGKIIVK